MPHYHEHVTNASVHHFPNKRSRSNKRGEKDVTLVSAARTTGTAQAKPGYLTALGPRDSRKPLVITARYIGGAEGAWILEARGRNFCFDSCIPLYEVMKRINNAQPG